MTFRLSHRTIHSSIRSKGRSSRRFRCAWERFYWPYTFSIYWCSFTTPEIWSALIVTWPNSKSFCKSSRRLSSFMEAYVEDLFQDGLIKVVFATDSCSWYQPFSLYDCYFFAFEAFRGGLISPANYEWGFSIGRASRMARQGHYWPFTYFEI